MPTGIPLTPLQVEKIKFMHHLDNTFQQIANAVGCSDGTIRYHLRKASLIKESKPFFDIKLTMKDIKEFADKFEVGQGIEVHIKTKYMRHGIKEHGKRTIVGTIIYKNEDYFTLQGRHRESFNWVDVMLGKIEVQNV